MYPYLHIIYIYFFTAAGSNPWIANVTVHRRYRYSARRVYYYYYKLTDAVLDNCNFLSLIITYYQLMHIYIYLLYIYI